MDTGVLVTPGAPRRHALLEPGDVLARWPIEHLRVGSALATRAGASGLAFFFATFKLMHYREPHGLPEPPKRGLCSSGRLLLQATGARWCPPVLIALSGSNIADNTECS
jgi:hypothetical protein